MADKQKQIVELHEWRDATNVWSNGKIVSVCACSSKAMDADGGRALPTVLMVKNRRIADAIKKGETYTGDLRKKLLDKENSQFSIPPRGEEVEGSVWVFEIQAKDNASIQKEDVGGFGGAPPSNVSTPQTPHNAHGGGQGGQGKGDRGMAIGCAINNAVRIAIAERGGDGEVSLDRVEEVGVRIMSIEGKLAGDTSTAHAEGKSEAASPPNLWPTVEEAITNAGLLEQFEASPIGMEAAMELWKASGMNPTKFGIALSGELGGGGVEDDPNSELPF